MGGAEVGDLGSAALLIRAAESNKRVRVPPFFVDIKYSMIDCGE